MTEKRRPGRPRKATPVKTKSGHSARIWVQEEGEWVRKQVPLGTRSKVVATARGKRLLAGEAPELIADKSESFERAAEKVLEASTVKNKARVLSLLRRRAFPVFGDVPVALVTSVHIKAALTDAANELGGWTGSVRNLRDAVSMVLGALVEDRVVPMNEASRIKFKRKDKGLNAHRIVRRVPPRLVLTDEEFTRLVERLVWEVDSGLWPFRGSFELLVLCLSARIFGMRTSDLHGWIWEMVDTAAFGDAYVPRPKTDGDLLDEPDDGGLILEAWRDEPRSTLPEALSGWLRLWWEKAGRPASGPVFPVRQGRRAGQQKGACSNYCRALRAALWRAGVYRPQAGFELAASDAERKKLCALQSGIARRFAPVDFHSFRRAAATAAGKAAAAGELTLRQAMEQTHHKDPQVFARYQAKEERITVPESSIPRILAAPTALSRSVKSTAGPAEAADAILAETSKGGLTSLARQDDLVSPQFSHTADSPNEGITRGATTERQNPAPVFEGLDGALRLAVDAAMREGDIDAATALLEVARRRKAPLPDNVRPLAPSARKGGKP